MKHRIEHPAPTKRELSGPRYWRSLDELMETPGFRDYIEREFPEGASSLEGVDRRQFFKLMAASFALGGIGLAGCRRPVAYILPYGKSIEEVKDGMPLFYATAMPLRRAAVPLVAKTYQGRPVKLEGNPSYLPNGGASGLISQGSLLDLYDPDRARTHMRHGAALSSAEVDDLLAGLHQKYAANQGAGLAFLADSSSSLTRASLVDHLRQKMPKAVWAEYEPVNDEPPLEAARMAFGRDVRPIYAFAEARRILSLDGDFLHLDPASITYARDFARGRHVTTPENAPHMNRLYVAESNLSMTGAMADHHLRIASSHVIRLAAALANRILGTDAYTPLTAGLDVKPEWIEECAQDLLAHRGACLVLTGAQQPAAVHALCHVMNAALGNFGRTVNFVAAEPRRAASLQDLAKAVTAGSVKTLIILAGNPVYNAPADLDWPALQKSVPEVIRYGYYEDETSELAGTHICATHYLESWGDARTTDGTIVPIQPMILPLFDGLTELAVLARVIGEETVDPYTLVYRRITQLTGGDPEKAFRKFLYEGMLEGTAYPAVDGVRVVDGVAAAIVASAPKPPEVGPDHLEVRFVADHKVDDGRFANNGWLQECPDPITRLTWDNAIYVSTRLGKALGIAPKHSAGDRQTARIETSVWVKGRDHSHVAVLRLGGRTLRGPIQIQPGLANNTVVLPLGYGRTRSGRNGNGAGFSAYAVRTSDAMDVAVGATLEVLPGDSYQLADTQAHWSMEGRAIIREANVDEFIRDPKFVRALGLELDANPYNAESINLPLATKVTEIPRGNSLYKTPTFTAPQQWGMSIDLNTCIGCNACVVACQAENNVPVVGKYQVYLGREMHWIRIDRYYSDGHIAPSLFGGPQNLEIPEDPQVSLQPLPCQQCELAPCEMVCPVNATVHDEQGLNLMVYNRCVGTRYCANNCPYKVRRFNYFDWNKHATNALYMGPFGHQKQMPELLWMVRNPQVTVRMRGVMEKCTYCQQRIENAKINWKVKEAQAGDPGNIIVPDGVIKTACQQVCPVGAIVFGDLLQPDSAVSKAKAQPRTYQLLDYLNTRPRTSYLGKLRNPNRRMPDYFDLPMSRVEENLKNYDTRQTPSWAPGGTDNDKYPFDSKPVHRSDGGTR